MLCLVSYLSMAVEPKVERISFPEVMKSLVSFARHRIPAIMMMTMMKMMFHDDDVEQGENDRMSRKNSNRSRTLEDDQTYIVHVT